MRSIIAALVPHLRRRSALLIAGGIAGVLMNTLVVLPPLMLGRAIDVATAYASGSSTSAAVVRASVLFVLASAATEGPRLVKRWFLTTGRQEVLADLRVHIVEAVLRWPLARVLSTPVGTLLARIGGDVDVVGAGLKEILVETWDSALLCVSMIVAMATIDARLALLFGLPPVFVAMIVSLASGRLVAKRTRAARSENAGLVSTIHERLVGARLLHLVGAGAAAVREVRRRSLAQAEANVTVARLAGVLGAVYTTLVNAGIGLVLVFGGSRVLSHTMTIGAFVAFLELYRRFVDRAHRVPQMMNGAQSGLAALERVSELLPNRAVHVVRPTDVSRATGDDASASTVAVQLRGVHLQHEGALNPTLAGLDVAIAAGSFVGIAGPIGAGKSTLARLIVGLSPTAGDVLLRPSERVGYAPDDVQLISGTLRDNVAFGADSGHVDEAIHVAALDDDVAAFPQGASTEIGERGVRVSGGQRKRIAVARALAAYSPDWPTLLVLDEPFASVDVQTEATMIERLRAFALGRHITLVIVSHRLAAFTAADRVLVLDAGHVVADGTHQALLLSSPLYARLVAVGASER